MPRYVVRVGYDWVLPVVKDVEVAADSEVEAMRIALAQSRADGDFWTDADELDGEAGPTEVISVVVDAD